MHVAEKLARVLGHGKIKSGAEVAGLDPGLDARNLLAGAIVFPQSTEDVSAVLAFCNAHGIGIVPQGGRTGLAGGAVSGAGQAVLSLQRMNRILKLQPQSSVVMAEAGVVLETLDEALAAHGLSAGIDLGARGSATVGGMIATNAGGIEAFRNGVMRSRVMGLEAVLADGTVVSDLSEVAKCNEGYDVKQLFIGAEGTLGVVTKAVIRAVRRPVMQSTALVTTGTAAAAVRLFHDLASRKLLAFEMMTRRYFSLVATDHGQQGLLQLANSPYCFIVEMECSEDELVAALAEADIIDAVLAKSSSERVAFWKIREDSFVVGRIYPGGLWYDISVPLQNIDSYLEGLEARIAAVAPVAMVFAIGHLGDGNLHLTIAGPQPLKPIAKVVTDAVYAGLKPMGGLFSAEHGIGLEKRESLAMLADPGKLMVMRRLKQALDPKGIMKPGRVLDA